MYFWDPGPVLTSTKDPSRSRAAEESSMCDVLPPSEPGWAWVTHGPTA